MVPTPVRVLIVDDDEACYLIAKEGLLIGDSPSFLVAWEPTYAAGMQRLSETSHDICLVDYRLDGRTGLEFIREAHDAGCRVPMIVFTGMDDQELAAQALRAGAADFLLKHEINASTMRRSIRYALERERAQDDRRAAQELLDNERQLLRTLIESMPDRIYVKDTEGRYVMDNAAHREFVGVDSIDEIVGRTASDFFSASLAALYDAADKGVIRSGQSVTDREEAMPDENGRETWALRTRVPLRDAQGTITAVLGIGRDITAKKRAEQDRDQSERALRRALGELQKSHQELKATQLILIQAEKMESLGRLASGIAHEIKNPLGQILLGADFLGVAVGDSDESVTIVLEDIRNAVARADEIVRGLLDFSAPDELNLERRDLGKLVAESLELLHADLVTARVKVAVEFADDLPRVAIDPIKLRHVFINLTTNAIHAMRGGGQLLVKTYATTLAEGGRDEGTRAVERLRAGDAVIVAEISDTGHGISAENLPMIFDPFFTTKPAGKGAGLGLTVARKIVELHGGRLEVRNRPEGGVTATIMLKAKETQTN
jgi:PAS domain S-box-containing protein